MILNQRRNRSISTARLRAGALTLSATLITLVAFQFGPRLAFAQGTGDRESESVDLFEHSTGEGEASEKINSLDLPWAGSEVTLDSKPADPVKRPKGLSSIPGDVGFRDQRMEERLERLEKLVERLVNRVERREARSMLSTAPDAVVAPRISASVGQTHVLLDEHAEVHRQVTSGLGPRRSRTLSTRSTGSAMARDHGEEGFGNSLDGGQTSGEFGGGGSVGDAQTSTFRDLFGGEGDKGARRRELEAEHQRIVKQLKHVEAELRKLNDRPSSSN